MCQHFRIKYRMAKKVTPDSLGYRLKLARTRADMTQQELSDATGVRQASISKIERGDQSESGSVTVLARACGVRAEWLAEGLPPMLDERWNSRLSSHHYNMLSKVADALSTNGRDHNLQRQIEGMLRMICAHIDEPDELSQYPSIAVVHDASNLSDTKALEFKPHSKLKVVKKDTLR